jgi:integrase
VNLLQFSLNIYSQGLLLMDYVEPRGNLWYAVYYVPADVQHIIGKKKFLRSTKTSNRTEAVRRARAVVIGWEAEVAKARGQKPNSNDDFWESLRNQHISARREAEEGSADSEDLMIAIEDLAEQAASKINDPEQAALLYKLATGQGGTLLAPLVDDWKDAQRGGKKTIDQKHRDLERLAKHFYTLEALQPQKIKIWTDILMKEGMTYSSFARIGGACHSLWEHLQNASIVTMVAPDPFVGAFRLALKRAVRTDTGRSGKSYTAEQLSMIYSEALKLKDRSLADLIALGAYTGARVEELGRLRKETCVDGIFNIKKSKTDAGIREVPIHSAVAPLVARLLAASKDGYLVSSTSENQYDLRMAALGQKYTRLKKSLGFGPDLVFHSTRGTLITLMHQAGVEEGITADNVGHEKKTMSYGLYSSGSSMAQKREAMALVVYGGALGSP